jgi:glucoamylase
VAWTRAAPALVAAGAVGLALVSGGSEADPRTPAALPGLPPPFLGTTAVGSGGLTAAVDAYGDMVDLRAPGPAGRALIDNPAARQTAGSVPADTGIVPRLTWTNSKDLGGHRSANPSSSPGEPLWRADSVAQRYLPGTNVVRTAARFGRARVTVVYAARGARLGCLTSVRGPRGERARATRGEQAQVSIAIADPGAAHRLRCDDRAARRIVHGAARSDRRWLARARPLGAGAPAWAEHMYRRSLLTLRALTDPHTGAVAAGARDGWAYVWPRDAATAALAYAAAGYRPAARRVARFLLGLDLGAAARFHGDGKPVAGRGAQGDAAGWVAVAAHAAGLPPSPVLGTRRESADYQEGAAGRYVANAIAAIKTAGGSRTPPSGADATAGEAQASLYGPSPTRRREERRLKAEFVTAAGLTREPGARGGLDSAAAWAVRPFALPLLYPPARRTLLRLAGIGASGPPASRFGIVPSEHWPGLDPWTAPTAWSAWGLAALAAHEREHPAAARRDRQAALSLLADLRRAATPAGALPERVDARTGIPTSTTPLAWSAAFAVLALRELWPQSPRHSRPLRDGASG